MTDVEIRDTLINDRWPVRLPWYRAQRPKPLEVVP